MYFKSSGMVAYICFLNQSLLFLVNFVGLWEVFSVGVWQKYLGIEVGVYAYCEMLCSINHADQLVDFE